jgi:hypothetical protein
MAVRILDKLRQSPFSVEELAFDLKRKPYEVPLFVNALLREGSIIKLDTDREGGPFYVELSVGWPPIAVSAHRKLTINSKARCNAGLCQISDVENSEPNRCYIP